MRSRTRPTKRLIVACPSPVFCRMLTTEFWCMNICRTCHWRARGTNGLLPRLKTQRSSRA
eukprot:1255034-Amphidinium_carterae.1